MDKDRLEQLQNLAAMNREIYRDYPQKCYKKYGQEFENDYGIYLQYRILFRDNEWKDTLWKVTTFIPDNQKARRRRFYAANRWGRVLNLHTWAMLYNRDYTSLKYWYLEQQLSLEAALDKAKVGWKKEDNPFYKINLSSVEAAENGKGY